MLFATAASGGVIPMIFFGIVFVVVVLVGLPYMFHTKKKQNASIPDRALLYTHDFFGAVKDSPMNKPLSFITDKWGNPDLTFRSSNRVYHCWKVESYFWMKPGEKLFFVFAFNRKKDNCVHIETEPVSEEFLYELGYRAPSKSAKKAKIKVEVESPRFGAGTELADDELAELVDDELEDDESAELADDEPADDESVEPADEKSTELVDEEL
jgi:hypothetical protein